jgi:hypothetical protein
MLIPLLYWCYDEKKALRLGTAVLISAWLNITLKLLLNQPRPFFTAWDPAAGMMAEPLGGLPSGHAQNSLVLWMIAASWGKKKRHFAAAALLCLLISFSRLYLGVHFPTDILGGWIMGALALCAYFLFGGKIENLLVRGGLRAGAVASAAAAFMMILYRPDYHVLMPGAILLGMGTGYCLNRRLIGFSSAAPFGTSAAAKWPILLVRFVLGMAVIALIYAAFATLMPHDKQSQYYPLLYFIRYAVLAFGITAGAPWLFCFLRLAAAQPEGCGSGADN